MKTIVSTDWLAAHLDDADICVLDGSWYLPSAGRDPYGEYKASHIPGAQFFDISAIKDTDSPLPNMLPSPKAFETAVRALGCNANSKIIIYDGAGIGSSARVWWMFRAMGHDNVYVLDGGLPKWTDEARAVTAAPTTPTAGNFTAKPQPELVANWEQVLSAGAQVLDARASERFCGRGPEPRQGLRAGHMPGANNIPHGILKTSNGTLKPNPELADIFTRKQIDLKAPIITTCGSGITACIIALALHRIGITNAAVYDGSWAEWGSRPDLPLETSLA